MFGEIYRLRKEDLGQWFDLWEKSGEDPESFRTAAEEKTDLIAKMKPDFMDDERFARIVFLAVSGSVELEEDKVPCEPPQEKDPSGFPDGGDLKGYLQRRRWFDLRWTESARKEFGPLLNHTAAISMVFGVHPEKQRAFSVHFKAEEERMKSEHPVFHDLIGKIITDWYETRHFDIAYRRFAKEFSALIEKHSRLGGLPVKREKERFDEFVKASMLGSAYADKLLYEALFPVPAAEASEVRTSEGLKKLMDMNLSDARLEYPDLF